MLKTCLTAAVLSTLALTGCATVSVVPGTATVETQISEQQSALRESAVSFQTIAVSRGWISETRGFFDLARVLVEGGSETPDDAKNYASLIGAEARAPQDVLSTLTADISDAIDAFTDVSGQANTFLDADIDASTINIRADLVSYERALVQAQQTRRSFIEAATLAGVDSSIEVTTLIARMDAEIDVARDFADKIASDYSSRDAGTSIS